MSDPNQEPDFRIRFQASGDCRILDPLPVVPGITACSMPSGPGPIHGLLTPRAQDQLAPAIHSSELGEPWAGTIRLTRPNRVLECRLTPDGDGSLLEGRLIESRSSLFSEAEQASLQQLLNLVDADVFVVGPDRVVELVNRRLTDTWGLRSGQLLGLHLGDPAFRYASLGDAVRPSNADSPVDEAFQHKRPARAVGTWSAPWLARARQVEMTASPALDAQGHVSYVMVSLRDLSAHQASEERLRAEYDRAHQMLERSPMAVSLRSAHGEVTYLNPAARRVLGLGPDTPYDPSKVNLYDLEGQPIPPESRPAALVLATGQELAPTEYVVEHLGRRRVILVSGVPLQDREGKVQEVMLTCQDITLRHETAHTQARLNQQMDKLARYESLSVLAGGVAHDFNNLLMGVMGAAALAQEEAVSPVVQEQLQLIEQAGERGAELTRQLLAYAGRTPISVGRIDLNETVRSSWQLLEKLVRKGLRVDFDPQGEPVWVEADAAQVRQALMNLLLNASQAIEEWGHISVRVGRQIVRGPADFDGTERFAADAQDTGEFGVLEVEDDGTGMPPETLSRIFDPFFSTRPQQPGLGLAAVQGLAKAHGGWVAVQSAPDQGTRVRLGLPIWDGTAHGSAVAEQTNGWVPGRILVVEDEDMVAQFVVRALSRKQVEVQRAKDGSEGIELFDAHQEQLDAVLVDLTMPKIPGEQVLQYIRAKRPDMPVIVMSGYTPERPVDPDGPTRFLPKPFRPAQMWELLADLSPTGARNRVQPVKP